MILFLVSLFIVFTLVFTISLCVAASCEVSDGHHVTGACHVCGGPCLDGVATCGCCRVGTETLADEVKMIEDVREVRA